MTFQHTNARAAAAPDNTGTGEADIATLRQPRELVAHGLVSEAALPALEQVAAGEEINLGAKTTSYKEWAEGLQQYAQGEEVKEQGEYWEGLARRAREVKRLPVDQDGGENTVGAARTVEVSLSREETAALLSEVPAVRKVR